MWIKRDIIEAVDEVAVIHYVDMLTCQAWNQNRREGEIRLLTGWCWSSKTGNSYQQGLKTKTQAYRDCWYKPVNKTSVPLLNRRTLRRVV